MRPAAHVVLLHGAATTARVWDDVRQALRPWAAAAGWEVLAPDRPCTGDLDAECAALADACAGAVVVGVSGGATLGLALAARLDVAAAVLHEPAVGSLAPGLLAPFRRALEDGGVAALGRALYGPSWSIEMAHRPGEPADEAAARVRRDVAMFAAAEPVAPRDPAAVLVTVGECSPDARHLAAQALRAAFGVRVHRMPGAGHAVHLDAPGTFAALVATVADGRPVVSSAAPGRGTTPAAR